MYLYLLNDQQKTFQLIFLKKTKKNKITFYKKNNFSCLFFKISSFFILCLQGLHKVPEDGVVLCSPLAREGGRLTYSKIN